MRDLRFGTPSSFPAYLTNVSGTLFYVATDGGTEMELWTSDGTSAGTKLVRNLDASSGHSFPKDLTNVGGTLFFRANLTPNPNNYELWKSDGTRDGTVPCCKRDPCDSPGANPRELTNVAGTLFFRANDGSTGYELWKSDGTTAGTVQVKDIFPGAGPSTPRYLANINGLLYFTANDGINGEELWMSDGTPAGTRIV